MIEGQDRRIVPEYNKEYAVAFQKPDFRADSEQGQHEGYLRVPACGLKTSHYSGLIPICRTEDSHMFCRCREFNSSPIYLYRIESWLKKIRILGGRENLNNKSKIHLSHIVTITIMRLK